MTKATWTAQASANIALIKYMGKTDHQDNRPTNSSLSYTLPHLLSHVEVTLGQEGKDEWEPLLIPEATGFKLTEKGQGRFLAHVERIKKHFGCKTSFKIRSNNAFPADCGLASSASSFAALTQALVESVCDVMERPLPPVGEIAELSRQGSGSSCRSFFSPWSVWDREGVGPVELPYGDLYHQVIVVNDQVKAVSSSEAHQRVATSPLFIGRPERAERRLEDLLVAFRERNWRKAYEITWSEFWDMHVLFETSQPPFGYMAPGSLEVLSHVRSLWSESGDGPLVTMDAGPNVHLLYRPEQKTLVDQLRSHFEKRFLVICSLDWQRKRGAQ